MDTACIRRRWRSIGAALGFWYQELSSLRKLNTSSDSMSGSYLGPKFDEKTIEINPKKTRCKFY